MAKIFIVGEQEWETPDRGGSGQIIKGKSYIGYLPGDKPIKFTSREQYVCYVGEVAYDEARAVEIPLLTKMFAGKVSYQDGNSFGRKNPL